MDVLLRSSVLSIGIWLYSEIISNKAVQEKITLTSPQKGEEQRLRLSKMVPIETMAMARRVQDSTARPGNKIRTRLEGFLKRVFGLKFGA